MSVREGSFSKNVFIDCPFDSRYIPLLRPLLFTVLSLEYNPRIASESFDSGEARLSMICQLIRESKFSIHDISRIKASSAGELYRLNMPFELGVDLGCRLFSGGEGREKRCLILEKERFRYQRALSDMSNSDIKSHGDDPERLVREVRNWFVEIDNKKASSPTRIWENFHEFVADFYERREEEGFAGRDLEMMPVSEYISFIKEWLAGRLG